MHVRTCLNYAQTIDRPTEFSNTKKKHWWVVCVSHITFSIAFDCRLDTLLSKNAITPHRIKTKYVPNFGVSSGFFKLNNFHASNREAVNWKQKRWISVTHKYKNWQRFRSRPSVLMNNDLQFPTHVLLSSPIPCPSPHHHIAISHLHLKHNGNWKRKTPHTRENRAASGADSARGGINICHSGSLQL